MPYGLLLKLRDRLAKDINDKTLGTKGNIVADEPLALEHIILTQSERLRVPCASEFRIALRYVRMSLFRTLSNTRRTEVRPE